MSRGKKRRKRHYVRLASHFYSANRSSILRHRLSPPSYLLWIMEQSAKRRVKGFINFIGESFLLLKTNRLRKRWLYLERSSKSTSRKELIIAKPVDENWRKSLWILLTLAETH